MEDRKATQRALHDAQGTHAWDKKKHAECTACGSFPCNRVCGCGAQWCEKCMKLHVEGEQTWRQHPIKPRAVPHH